MSGTTAVPAADVAAAGRGRGGRLPSLTGVRWFAALLVFGEHYRALRLGSPAGAEEGAAVSGTDRVLEFLFGTGYIGVSCFFVLSGFIMAWSARPGDTAGAFWRRRFARIYPVFAVSTVAAILLLVAAGTPPGIDLLLVQAFLVQAWVPDQAFSFGLNPVTWSLSAEAFFYFCFPALFLLMSGARERILRTTIACAVVFLAVVPWLASRALTVAGPTTEIIATADTGGPFLYWFTYVFPPVRLAEFVVGMAAGILVARGRWRGPRVPVALAVVAVGFVVNQFLPGFLQREAGMVVPFVLLIAALARADLDGTWSPLRSRPLRFLGEVSFALYAVQLVVIAGTGVFLRQWLAGAGLLADPALGVSNAVNALFFFVYLLACVLVAWVVHRWVERPMVRLLTPRRAARP